MQTDYNFDPMLYDKLRDQTALTSKIIEKLAACSIECVGEVIAEQQLIRQCLTGEEQDILENFMKKYGYDITFDRSK